MRCLGVILIALGLTLSSGAAPAWAAPSVCATSHGAETSATTSHTLNIPSPCSGDGSGELILVTFGRSANNTTTWPNNANDSSTQVYPKQASGTGVCEIHARFRLANGADSSTWVVTTSDSIKVAYQARRITGYQGTPEGTTVADAGANQNPNPPLVTPSWGSAEDLLIVQMCHSLSATVSTWPSGYASAGPDAQEDNTTTGTSVGTASTTRTATITTEDPGTWTITASQRWAAATIAIQPAAAAAGAGSRRMQKGFGK